MSGDENKEVEQQEYDVLTFVENNCPDCHGTGEIWVTDEDTVDCVSCGSTGKVTGDDVDGF